MATKRFPTDLSSKTSLTDDDLLLIADSEASNLAKYTSVSNLSSKIGTDNFVDITVKADKVNVLELDNITSYTPTADYHPTTKLYVDTLTDALSGVASDKVDTATFELTAAVLNLSIEGAYSAVSSHAGLFDNPHSVTRDQVGLSAYPYNPLDLPISTDTQLAVDTLSGAIDDVVSDTTFLSGAIDDVVSDTTFLSGAIDDVVSDTVFLSGAIDDVVSDTVFLSGAIDDVVSDTIFLSGAIDDNTSDITALSGYFDGSTPFEGVILKSYVDTSVPISSNAGVLTIDCSLGSVFTTTLSGDISSIVFSNGPSSGYVANIILIVTQDPATPRTIAWGSILFNGGSAPTVTATVDAIDIFSFMLVGSTVYGYITGQNMS